MQNDAGSILIVDDQRPNLVAMEAVLASLKARIVTATSGNEALSTLLHGEFAIALLDVRMPGMDGLELARIIRSREETRRLPIVFVTAQDDQESVTAAYALGAIDYIRKAHDTPLIIRQKVSFFLDLYQRGQVIREQAARLERSNRELERIGHVIAHDAMGPARRMRSFAQQLEQELPKPLTARTQHLIMRITAGADDLERVVNGIMDYARVGFGAAQLETVLVPPLIESIAQQIPVADFVRCKELPASLATAMAPFRQVLTNLVMNAYRHKDEQTTHVQVSAIEHGEVWEFVVADDGPGIAEDVRERLFKMFERLNPSTSGSGVGLAMSKTTVESVGGRMWFESAPTRRGATFHFTWPKKFPTASALSVPTPSRH